MHKRMHLFFKPWKAIVCLQYSFSQLCTGLELGDFLSGNGNRLFGSGVNTSSFASFRNHESSKTNEGNLVTLLQSLSDRCNNGINGFL